jgi:hypothetical protein
LTALTERESRVLVHAMFTGLRLLEAGRPLPDMTRVAPRPWSEMPIPDFPEEYLARLEAIAAATRSPLSKVIFGAARLGAMHRESQ